jgi:hypothetical protein
MTSFSDDDNDNFGENEGDGFWADDIDIIVEHGDPDDAYWKGLEGITLMDIDSRLRNRRIPSPSEISEAIAFLDWDVVPGVAPNGVSECEEYVPVAGDLLASYNEAPVGWVSMRDMCAFLDGELPLIDLGKFDSMAEAQYAVSTGVMDKLSQGWHIS